MYEKTIITPEDVRKVRPIAENLLDVKRLIPYIREAETLDVMPAIGVGLYKQIIDDNFQESLRTNNGIIITTNSGNEILLSSDLWAKFLNGAFYKCGNSCDSEEDKYSEGLISAIAYLAYSRMLPNQPLNVTAFGVVKKQTTLSEPVEEKELFRATNGAKKIGLEYLRQAVEHLKCEGFIDERKVTNKKRYRKFKAIG